MEEEMTNETFVTQEAENEENDLRERLSRYEEENAFLKRTLICSEMGVPAELTEDVVRLGEIYAERDNVDFEEAARSVYGRLAGRKLTTGIMSEAPRSSGDALRKAFGLK